MLLSLKATSQKREVAHPAVKVAHPPALLFGGLCIVVGCYWILLSALLVRLNLCAVSLLAGCPTLRFLKGGIPRSSPAWDFLLTPAAPSFMECTDDPHHPTLFAKCAKRMGHPASPLSAGRPPTSPILSLFASAHRKDSGRNVSNSA
jgi:hypothetical protein